MGESYKAMCVCRVSLSFVFYCLSILWHSQRWRHCAFYSASSSPLVSIEWDWHKRTIDARRPTKKWAAKNMIICWATTATLHVLCCSALANEFPSNSRYQSSSFLSSPSTIRCSLLHCSIYTHTHTNNSGKIKTGLEKQTHSMSSLCSLLSASELTSPMPIFAGNSLSLLQSLNLF